MIFSGSSHPILGYEIAEHANIVLGKRNLHLFPDGEIFVEILEHIQGRDIFLFQSLGENPNFYLMETLIILDALKRGAAASITVVFSYYAYARQDRMNKPGTPITAKLLADLLVSAGATQLIALDLHSESIEGFFDIPVYHITSYPLLIRYCETLVSLKNTAVVGPDKGAVKVASAFAKKLGVPLALIDKERIDSFKVEMKMLIGDVRGKTVILTDDICSTGGTLVTAAKICEELGAKRILATVSHGLFIEDALDKIENSPIELIIVTNSVPMSEKIANHPKVRLISVASLLGEVIKKNKY